MAKFMDFKGQGFNDIAPANYVSGLEKILAPIVLVHLRECSDFTPKALEAITFEVFVSFCNLVIPSG